jgi:hypothetical protein
MRKFEDLNDMDKGAFIVRNEIAKYKNEWVKTFEKDSKISNNMRIATITILNDCLNICDECLDIATFGEIE